MLRPSRLRLKRWRRSTNSRRSPCQLQQQLRFFTGVRREKSAFVEPTYDESNSGISAKSRSVLEEALEADGLYLSPEVVKEFAKTLDSDDGSPRSLAASLLRALTPWRNSRSPPPISNFRVLGLALSKSTGEAFVGANLEFPGHPIAITVHAEQFAIANMMGRAIRGGTSAPSLPEISHLALAVTPCGHCRQMLQELSSASELEVVLIANEHTLDAEGGGDQALHGEGSGCSSSSCDSASSSSSCSSSNSLEVYSLRKLLPLAFGPHSVGISRTQCIPLHVEEARSELPRGLQRACGIGLNAGGFGNADARCLGDVAVAAASMSYSPYTASHSGAAIVTREGVIGAGAYLESAAFNPSIPPLHAALIDLMSRQGQSCPVAAGGEIYEAFLCESPEAPIRHADSSRALLSAVAPGVELQEVEPWFG